MKKLLSVILALTLIISSAAIAFAAPVETGSITVNNVAKSTVLDVYKILTYDYDSDLEGFQNVKFLDGAYKAIFVAKVNAEITKANAANDPADEDLPLIADADEFAGLKALLYITEHLKTDSAFANELGVALAAAVETGVVADYSKAATDDVSATGSYTFTGLPMGYYLILDKTDYGLDEDKVAVNVMLQPMNPNAVVNLKTATHPPIDKVADDNSYNIGDAIGYTITIPVPQFENPTSGVASFIVTDTLGKGATAPTTAAGYAVKLAGADLDVDDDFTFVQSIDAGVTTTIFTFTAASIAKFEAAVGKNLVITYSAVVNNDAGINGIINDVTTNNFYGNPQEDTVTVYTYGFEIDKHDADDSDFKLEGVVFNLKLNGTAQTFTYNETLNTYFYDKDSTVTSLVTDADGYIKVWGLKAGTYSLEEISTVLNYNLLDAPVSVVLPGVVEGDGDGEVEIVTLVPFDVPNKAGIKLPGTGGIGTALFTIMGITLMAGASAILVLNKKRLFGR